MATLSPPVSPEPHSGRPQMNGRQSYMSNRSRRSSHSTNKLDLVETHSEKKRLNTKADPSVALKEAQPAAVALEASNLDDIRAVQHKDQDGNIITDPDRSNPTRYRLERPLDTIRAFHAAADGTSNRRSSYQSRPSQGYGQNGQDNRRSSYYNNGGYPPQQRPRPGPGAGGYYRNSSYGMRPEAFAEEPALPQPPYGRPPRQQGPSHYANGESSSPPGHSYQQSYETMTSGSEDYGKSTNPSSQNSSFDRLHQMHGRKPDEYGHYDEIQPVQPPNGYGQYPQYGGYQNQNPNMNGYANGQINGQMNGQMQRGGPMPPAANNPRIPIKLTTSNSGPPPTMADLNKELPAKRQSWFKRKISRRDS